MTVSSQLVTVLRELGFPVARVTRQYPGVHQRSAGAWAWCGEDERGMDIVASAFTMKEVVRAHRSPGMRVATCEKNWFELVAEVVPEEVKP